MYDFSKWTDATAALPWGAQRALHDTLSLVAEDKVTLVWGADYYSGSPCLVNAAATMLAKIHGEGGDGKPSNAFPDVVGEFDRINSHLKSVGVNKDNYVSPAAAEVLVHHFAPLREQEISDQINEATKNEAFAQAIPYREPTDEEITRDWLTALSTDNCVTDEEQEFQREAENFDRAAELAHDEWVHDTLKERNL